MQQKWVFPLSILALAVPLVIILIMVLNYTHGTFAYPLDDAFIHMGIAKNLALHHVWGISKFEFSSASSSILYPPLLAAIFLVTGPNIIVPYIVNFIAAVILLRIMQVWLIKRNGSPRAQLIILITAIYLIPLPVIIAIGMEHTLQILFCLLFIFKFSDWIKLNLETGKKKWEISWQVFAYGALVTAIRYEGMFLIFIACCLLLYFKQLELSFELGVIAMLPIMAFGIYSMSNGNYFFPTSVILKSNPIPMTVQGIWFFLRKGLFDKIFYADATNSAIVIERLLIILPLIYLLFRQLVNKNIEYRVILIFLTLATFFHLAFANTTWFYRYEAYLLAPTILVIGLLYAKHLHPLLIEKLRSTRAVILFLELILITPFLLRSYEGITTVKGACINIYDQNYHMGKFMQQYYDTARIAINDLGCPSFYVDGKIIDLWGLGNIEVANSKRYHYYNTPFLDSLVRKERVKVAAVFDRLYPPSLLQKWHKIATWHINKIVVAGDYDLCFYAVDSTASSDLLQNLQAYQKRLPPNVSVHYQQIE